MINIIVAIGKNNEIGQNNELIWRLKKDLNFFRQTTWNKDIIMGRKTFESLPKLLPHRNHIVLTRKKIEIANVKIYNNIDMLIMEYMYKDAFVIGGGSIYKQFLKYAENMYITEIQDTCEEADTFFPLFKKENFKKTIIKEDEENGIKFKHALYKRRH